MNYHFYAAIAGVAVYNNSKLRKEVGQSTPDESQHDESEPLTSSAVSTK